MVPRVEYLQRRRCSSAGSARREEIGQTAQEDITAAIHGFGHGVH